jgi:hypothetical protein
VVFVNPIVQKIIVCPPKKYLPYPPFRDDLPASEDVFPKEIETHERKEKKVNMK